MEKASQKHRYTCLGQARHESRVVGVLGIDVSWESFPLEIH